MNHLSEVKKGTVIITVKDKEGKEHDITSSTILSECINTENIPSIDDLLDYRLLMQSNIDISDKSHNTMPDWWYEYEIMAVDYIIHKTYNLKIGLKDKRRKIRNG